MIHSYKYSIIFKTAVLYSAALAIVLRCGLPGEGFWYGPFSTYGMISGLMTAVYYALSLLITSGKGNGVWCPSLKFMTLISAILVSTVVHFMLGSQYAGAGGTYRLALQLLHTVIPVGLLLDWLLFDAHGVLRVYDPLLALIPPAIYGLLVLFGWRVGMGITVHYWFLNTANLGTPTAVLILLGLGAGIVAVGYLFYFLDRIMSRATRTRRR